MGVIKTGYAIGATMSIGVMHPKDIAYARARGAVIESGMIYVSDRLLASSKASRHIAAGDGLSVAEWKALPQTLANAKMVLWDKPNKTVLYIVTDKNSVHQKTVVRFSRGNSGNNKVEDAATIFKISDDDIRSGLIAGRFEIIR